MDNRMEWDVDVSILTNRFILLEVGRALTIAFLFAAVIISMIMLPSLMAGSIFSAGIGTSGLGYSMLMIGLLFLFTAVFIFFYYGNKYMLSYVVDEKGVRTVTRKAQRSRNRTANILLILMGFLSHNPAVAGAGMMAAGGQDQSIRWNKVKKVTFHPKHHTIVLRGGYGARSVIFCPQDTYEPVSSFIRSHCRAASAADR
jgi:hypothetical protein